MMKRLRDSIKRARQAIASGNLDLANAVGKEMCDIFEADYNISDEAEYTPEMAALQYECLTTLLDLHILRGEPIDISIRYAQILKKYRMDREHFKSWPEADWNDSRMHIEHAVMAVERFFNDSYHKRYESEVATNHPFGGKCALCREREADKTGSHMVPHMLIARTFSYDGSPHRDKVVVEVDHLSTGEKERYFGHHVYDDTVNELIGRSFSDEEMEAEANKRNALTRDHMFCSDCEKRFGTIESFYADILDGKAHNYPTQIPYLFWMSVAWRMSVGGMGMKMKPEHEEKLRRILNRCLSVERDGIITDRSKLGYCAYTLHRAVDTRDERLGILAIHSPTKPYFALIGNLLFNFFITASSAHSHYRRYSMPASYINDGERHENIGSLDFIEFWMVKRQILDDSWKEERSVWNMGSTRNVTLSKIEPDMTASVQSVFGDDMKDISYEGIPTWFNSENPMVVTYPRAILKILKWSKENPDKTSIEELSDGTGYTKEELLVMLDYFHDKSEKQLKQMEAMEKRASAMDGLLDLF